ncbi:MAG: two-component regulator propeller domain-containing protein [Eubacteriales bacterium]|nr:two-component regulator propeller domain-containing protein [Eubacteriales bacterium]
MPTMQIDKKFTKILCPIFVLMIFCLMVSCSAQEKREVLFKNILEGKEVSDIVLYKGFVYASGMEGVYRIDPNTLDVETLDLGRVFLAKDMAVDGEILYIGHDGGIVMFDGENYASILDETFNVRDFRVNGLMIDAAGILWAGTYGGVLKLSEGVWESITVKDGLLFDTVFLIMEDGYGGIIFGHYASSRDGISYLKNGQWSYFTVETGLPHNYITAGMRIENFIYITTGFYEVGGIAVFETSSNGITLVDTIVEEWGEYGSKARSINNDGDYLWIGTEYNGLCIMQEDEFVRLDTDDGLVNNEVKAILFDDRNRVWLATRKGLSVASMDQLYQEFQNRK